MSKSTPVCLLALLLYLASCLPVDRLPAQSADSTACLDCLNVYFSDPASPLADEYTGGPDGALVAAIDSARLSLDVAAYDFNLWSLRDALLRAQRRGVVVRMVMESENMDSNEVQQLMEAGIPVRGDFRKGLMHNKFVIIDRSEVWTGSMNYTVGAVYRDNNNLLRIRSSLVAEDYTAEFDEMFLEDKFGEDIGFETPHPSLNIDGTPLEIYFSPDDGVAARLLELIQAAQASIHFMAFTFTADELGQAIRAQAQAGLTVLGVMDADQVNSSPGTEIDSFLQAGLQVYLDGNEGLLHHKVIIIDQSIVITGSYNFTASAEQDNDENVVIIFNPQIANQFLAEFQRMLALAQSQ